MLGLRRGAWYERFRHKLLQLFFLLVVGRLLSERDVIEQIVIAVVGLLILLPFDMVVMYAISRGFLHSIEDFEAAFCWGRWLEKVVRERPIGLFLTDNRDL